MTSGEYLLTIERPDFASVGRPLEIRNYKEPRTVVLDIRLKGNESASFREVVKAYGSLPSDRKTEEESKRVSRKAGQAYLKASAAAAKGDRAKAIRHLRKAVRAQPEFFEAHYNLGVHYQALEQWENATRAYLRAIELRQNTARPNFNLGVIYHNQGKLDQAIQRYQQALEYDPSFAEAHQALGEARFPARSLLRRRAAPGNGHPVGARQGSALIRTAGEDTSGSTRIPTRPSSTWTSFSNTTPTPPSPQPCRRRSTACWLQAKGGGSRAHVSYLKQTKKDKKRVIHEGTRRTTKGH